MSLESDLASVRKSILTHQQNNNSVAVEQMSRIEKQILSKMQSSKPGENAVDRALRLTKGDAALDRATADAKAFLNDRYDRFAALDLPTDLAKPFEDVENLSGVDYPQAFQSPVKGGGRVRIGTEFEVNDVTGERTIVPSADPVEKGKALTLFEGTQQQALQSRFGQDAAEIPNKTEYVQRQIMRRMGLPAVMNNEGDAKTATDFRVGSKKVDGQTHRTTWDRPKLQAYTWINGPDETPFDNQQMPQSQRQASADNVKNIILDEMDANPGRGLQGAVTDLGEDRVLSGSRSTDYMPTVGKLFQEGEYKKDAIFMSDYEPSFHIQNRNAGDTISKAPKDIRMQDLNRARAVVNSMGSDELAQSLEAFPNETQGGKFPGRTQLHIMPSEQRARQFTVSGDQIRKETPQVRQFLDESHSFVRKAGKVLRNPVVRGAGVALGAIPVLGDAADAATGTYDAVTKKGDQQVRGAGNAVAGITGLASVAAPVAAPVLAPVSIGLGTGNLLADATKERRANDKKYTANTGSVDPFIHSEAAPVTISGPSAVTSETQRRRNARRSTHGVKARPSTGAGWWNKALGALGLQ